MVLALDYITCNCKRPRIISTIFTGQKYKLKLYYCKRCSTWIEEKGTYVLPSGRRCTCCHFRVRETPRAREFKEKFRNER